MHTCKIPHPGTAKSIPGLRCAQVIEAGVLVSKGGQEQKEKALGEAINPLRLQGLVAQGWSLYDVRLWSQEPSVDLFSAALPVTAKAAQPHHLTAGLSALALLDVVLQVCVVLLSLCTAALQQESKRPASS